MTVGACLCLLLGLGGCVLVGAVSVVDQRRVQRRLDELRRRVEEEAL